MLVVEDDAIVRSWIRLALADTEFRVAGEAETAAIAIELVARRRPTILLVDQHLPDGLGTDLVKELRRRGVAAPAVLVTANAERGLNERAREAGAQGTVLKSADPGGLVSVLRIVVAGGEAYDPSHPRRPSGRGPLTPRERDVLRLAADGLTNRQIADELGIGRESVKTLLERAFVKLGAANRTEAVSSAIKLGVL
jgi:DNA-binding NarL/FixJ family response regulator